MFVLGLLGHFVVLLRLLQAFFNVRLRPKLIRALLVSTYAAS